jgi:hypothetical protein
VTGCGIFAVSAGSTLGGKVIFIYAGSSYISSECSYLWTCQILWLFRSSPTCNIFFDRKSLNKYLPLFLIFRFLLLPCLPIHAATATDGLQFMSYSRRYHYFVIPSGIGQVVKRVAAYRIIIESIRLPIGWK